MYLHRGSQSWFRQDGVKSLQEEHLWLAVKESQEHFSWSSPRDKDKAALGILPIRQGTSPTVSLRVADGDILETKLPTR